MAYLGNLSLPFDPTRTAAAPRDADRFSGNASTVTFTLSRFVQKAVDLEVYVENVRQEPITAYDVNGTSLTFTGAPPSGTNNVYVVYRNFDSGAQSYVPDGSITYNKLANNIRIFTTDNLTPNGNNSVFTLSEPPADANTVMVTVDGIIQRAPVHYTTSGSTITFTSAPAAGSNVHVRHLGFRTSTTVTQLAANSFISQPNIASPTISGTTTTINTRVGVGTTPNTSWSSSYPSIEFAGKGFVGGYDLAGNSTGAQLGIATMYDGTNWRYTANVASSTVVSVDPVNGFLVYTAGPGTIGGTVNYVNQLQVANSGQVFANSGYGSMGLAYFCRAWVNFNGTGTVAIRGSGNVSSITDGGTGLFTVNFSNTMPDTNYSTFTTKQLNTAAGTDTVFTGLINTYGTTSGVGVFARAVDSTLYDPVVFNVAVFR